MNNAELKNSLERQHSENEKTMVEVTSGIINSDRLSEYKQVVKYFNSEDFEVYKKLDEFDFYDELIVELERVVSELEKGKKTIRGDFGRKLQIISDEKVEKGKKVYLFKKVEHPPVISFGKKVDKLLVGALGKITIGNIEIHFIKNIVDEELFNLDIKSVGFKKTFLGDIVITSTDEGNLKSEDITGLVREIEEVFNYYCITI